MNNYIEKNLSEDFNYVNTDLSGVYSTFDDINNQLNNLPPLKTNTSNCQYPKDKTILIPGKGWTKVKECFDGSYIEADKYKYEHRELTPEQRCAQRKAGALANNLIADCSDLGL